MVMLPQCRRLLVRDFHAVQIDDKRQRPAHRLHRHARVADARKGRELARRRFGVDGAGDVRRGVERARDVAPL